MMVAIALNIARAKYGVEITVVMITCNKSMKTNCRSFDRRRSFRTLLICRAGRFRTLRIVKIPKILINTIGRTHETIGPKKLKNPMYSYGKKTQLTSPPFATTLK